MKIKARSRRPLLDLNVFLEVRNHISSDITLMHIYFLYRRKNTPNAISLPLFPFLKFFQCADESM